MANAGEPPALPETDDPYELLGVARDADVSTVKKAYARLVRLYRPDKSPREFERVHAAFEIVRAHGETKVPPPPPVEIAVAPPPIDEAKLAANLSARVAATGDDLQRRCDLLDELLAERVPLDVVFAREELRDAAVKHRTLTWSRLAGSSPDAQAVHAVWENIWRYAFEHDRERAVSLLDDDRLRRDASDHPALAMICVDRIAALAWVHTFDARALLKKLHDSVDADWLGYELDAVELDLACAASIRGRDWPQPLHVFVKLAIARRIDDVERRRELARELRESMTADLESTWVTFETLARDDGMNCVYEVIHELLPAHYTRLDALPKERFDELTKALHEAGSSPLTWKIRGGVLAGAAALGVIGWVPSVLLLGGAATYGLATETMRYRRQIRPRLAKAILDVPVTSQVIHRWVILNRKLAGRLTRYTPGIDNDWALHMFAMLAAYADALS